MLAKSKLNNIEVLISKALVVLNISHDELFLIAEECAEKCAEEILSK